MRQRWSCNVLYIYINACAPRMLPPIYSRRVCWEWMSSPYRIAIRIAWLEDFPKFPSEESGWGGHLGSRSLFGRHRRGHPGLYFSGQCMTAVGGLAGRMSRRWSLKPMGRLRSSFWSFVSPNNFPLQGNTCSLLLFKGTWYSLDLFLKTHLDFHLFPQMPQNKKKQPIHICTERFCRPRSGE